MKVWVYNQEAPLAPSPSRTNVEIENIINDVNGIFAPAGIRFYLKCGIQQIFDNRFWSINSESQDQEMKETYHDEWALNMHVIGDGITGRGEFPWRSLNASFSIGSTFSNSNLTAHEIGHTLGLYHTFTSKRNSSNNENVGKCYQEAVSRSKTQPIGCLSTVGKKKCDINGDGFCDTDADYSTSHNFNSGACGYIGTREDNWDDRFVPPTDNIMSYWNNCMSVFTPNQYSAMVIYLGVYSPLISNYFSHNGVSFMNLNSINVVGDVYNGETDEYIVPEEITNNDTLEVYSGGELNMQAQHKITLQDGFHAKKGSNFNAKVGLITDCNITYSSLSKTSSKSINVITYENEFQEELNSLVNSYLTEEKEDQLNKNKLLALSQEIKVYPTLLEDDKTINIDYNIGSEEFIVDISIYSMTGNKVGSFKVDHLESSGNAKLEMGHINKGYYIIKLITNKQIKNIRIFVTK